MQSTSSLTILFSCIHYYIACLYFTLFQACIVPKFTGYEQQLKYVAQPYLKYAWSNPPSLFLWSLLQDAFLASWQLILCPQRTFQVSALQCFHNLFAIIIVHLILA